MTTGEFIKELRNGNNVYKRKWTQEELGAALNPPVNRAAVNKWETGRIKNIKKTYIEQLAKMFGVTPAQLMCFDETIDCCKTSDKVIVIKQVEDLLDEDSIQLLKSFNKLNYTGKQKALETINDLSELSKYTDK